MSRGRTKERKEENKRKGERVKEKGRAEKEKREETVVKGRSNDKYSIDTAQPQPASQCINNNDVHDWQ